MTATGISRYAQDAGLALTAEVVNRHKRHYKDGRPVVPPGARKRDAAIIIKERVLDALDKVEEEERQSGNETGAWVLNKDLQPALRTALAAQNTEDTREKSRATKGTAEVAFAIIAMLRGDATPQPMAIDDGMTLDGEYEELNGAAI